MFEDDIATVSLDRSAVRAWCQDSTLPWPTADRPPMTITDRARHRLADWLQHLAEFVEP